MQGLLFDMIMEALLRSSVRIDWGRAEGCLRIFVSCGVGNYSAVFLKRKNCGRAESVKSLTVPGDVAPRCRICTAVTVWISPRSMMTVWGKGFRNAIHCECQ